MSNSPDRQSTRLKEYDYGLAGGYFVTILTHKKQKLFGEVVDGEVELNVVGEMVRKEWLALSDRFPSIHLDEFIIMPNHFHGILFLPGSAVGVGLVPTRGIEAGDHKGRPYGETGGVLNNPDLGEVIAAFKSITTNQYIKGVKTKNWPAFKKRVWHRNYHDRIIRNEKELENIRRYVMYNAMKEYEG